MQMIVGIGIALAIGLVAFALQNDVPVTVNFVVWRFDGSLAMVLLLAVSVGVLIMATLTTPATLKARWTQSRLNKKIYQLEAVNHKQELRIVELETAARLAGNVQPEQKSRIVPVTSLPVAEPPPVVG